jgi:hypothetical protein
MEKYRGAASDESRFGKIVAGEQSLAARDTRSSVVRGEAFENFSARADERDSRASNREVSATAAALLRWEKE